MIVLGWPIGQSSSSAWSWAEVCFVVGIRIKGVLFQIEPFTLAGMHREIYMYSIKDWFYNQLSFPYPEMAIVERITFPQKLDAYKTRLSVY